MSEITIPSQDKGQFQAYIVLPAKTPAPVVIVAQEIFGVNATMRGVCDKLAAQGYIAVCPDLFWRLEPGIQLSADVPAERARAFDLFGKFDVDRGIEDLRATLHTLKGHADSTGKVGCVGYCLGGKLAYLMACRSGVDCAVGYYGVGIDQLLDEAAKIHNPLLLHIAEEDKFVTQDAQRKIADGLEKNEFVSVYSYPGVDHAFAREGGESYNAAAATLANARTADFFRAHLS